MIGTLRNVFLSPSLPPSVVAAAAVQIPGRAPVDYFEPVAGGGGGPDGGSDSVAPFDGKRRGGSNQERNSKMAVVVVVVKRLHNALAKELVLSASL